MRMKLPLSRRKFTGGLAALSSLAIPATSFAKVTPRVEAPVGDNGLHTQSWFHDSFLEMADDAAEAADQGKKLVVLYEQRGCPYCKEMHEVNFAIPEIKDYIRENFLVVQLDLWGPRKVTDFDGEIMGERELAQRWRINFTPTTIFFPTSIEEGLSGRDLEVFRMPGYFKPFHFLSSYMYVAEERYKDTGFQRFVSERGDKLRAEGKEVDLW